MPSQHSGGISSERSISHEQKPSTVYTSVPADDDDAFGKTEVQPASWWYRITLDTWIPEVIAISISALCISGIAVVIYIFNGKTAPQIPYGITLNTIIAILATASRSMLIYTVSTAIGQLKWCLFRGKNRVLEDVQTMDAASRGPLGSIILLFVGGFHARPLASIGAVITVLALAFDPSTLR